MGVEQRRNPRAYLEAVVDERAAHDTVEAVRTTCSLARAERLIGQEYHGRFLIELLQNAADASRNTNTRSGRSRVLVRITEESALLVANKGVPMSADIVINSLGHIGASTKARGQAIGHKGIGFKSVLELTLKPEIYSGLRQPESALAVGFDPERAIKKIREASPDRWDEWVAEAQKPEPNDPLAAVPVLRFPYWIDELPPEVAELAEDGFDTVIRLPFDEHSKHSAQDWVQAVRRALEDVSDQILLLLGSFEEVRIEDCLPNGKQERISPDWEHEAVQIGPGTSRETVRVLRNDRLSSRWRLFRRELPDEHDLTGKIAVGVRVDEGCDTESVLSSAVESPAAPFHLFFPTRISSGLPFLLHAYFEVNAARTAFYDGSEKRNRKMMEGLAELIAVAVADLVEDERLSLASLVNLIARAGEPEDPLAQNFRKDVLDQLDNVEWIPLEGEVRRSAHPENMLSVKHDLAHLVHRLRETFSAEYVRERTDLGLPDRGLEPVALDLIDQRRTQPVDIWKTVDLLCRPGNSPPWEEETADKHFLSLVELFAALDGRDHEKTEALLSELRGKDETQLVPTVGTDTTRVLLPIPNPEEGASGQRSQLVMARIRSSDGQHQLVPPPALKVAFLPNGLLSGEAELARARPLGIRAFTVANILDRLRNIELANDRDREALARFLWQLLGLAQRTTDFDPSEWFWCKPGHGRDEASRQAQQRERNLTEVPLPCRDDSWRPAGRIAFGDDWADWLEERTRGRPTAATRHRIAAYRAMELLSPGPEYLLASPDKIQNLLDAHGISEGIRVPSAESERDEPDEEEPSARVHEFLLRLGVWEVPPIQAHVDWSTQNRERFPWPGETTDRQRETVEKNGGWKFGYGWTDRAHQNVYIAEDFRFLWSLEDMAGRNPTALVVGLRLGEKLYRRCSVALAFCPGCGGRAHTGWRHSSVDDGFPSSLAVQLGNAEWVPCGVDGERRVPTAPRSAWWHRKPPADGALRQSPWRFVPLCGPDRERPDGGLSEELRRLAGIHTMDDADADAVKALLVRLRWQFENGELSADPAISGSARQAFVGLHRLCYERLRELSSGPSRDVAAVLEDDEVGVLCELGENLVYRKPGEARHDDGRFATYTRYFVEQVPFAVLPRDGTRAWEHLGIKPFRLELTRRSGDKGRDVTDEVRDLHAERISELLAILVHHSLGGQTLDETSEPFEERARRLRNLRIRQLENLVVDITAEGYEEWPVTLGEHSRQDLYLENPTSSSPVLYHDLTNDEWQVRLRHKIAPYLATVVENQAYAHTFALYLQKENIDEREEFLFELGISMQEVGEIDARVGVVREGERRRQRRWFDAVLEARGVGSLVSDLDPAEISAKLRSAGLSAEVADRLVHLGGGEDVRRESGENSALRLLHEAGTDLKILHQNLLRDSEDSGLDIKDARNRFFGWRRSNHRWLAAVLAERLPPEEAKSKAGSLEPLAELRYVVDPKPSVVLAPVVRLLREVGVPGSDLPEKTVNRLASDKSKEELARLGRFSTVSELDARAKRLYDEEETQRELRDLAGRWRNDIHLLATLARTEPSATSRSIRQAHHDVERALPPSPSSPEELRGAAAELFLAHPELLRRIQERLSISLDANPGWDQLLEWARKDGVVVERLAAVREALDKPRAERARDLRDRSKRLAQRGVRPRPVMVKVPERSETEDGREGRVAPAEKGGEGGDGGDGGKVPVPPIKVGKGHDAHKRKLGDEGERWALASIVGDLMKLDWEARNAALDKITTLLRDRFKEGAVDMALSHEAAARRPDLDDEELFDELSGLLHVSHYSDLFGFDLIGWMPSDPNGEGRAVCVEVKSSGGEGFHLSRREWATAERFHTGGIGDQYAVLLVLRSRDGGVPKDMHILDDPVGLEETGGLKMEADGYLVVYETDAS